ncbi:hypothetical protein FS749_009263 [Ceratobasidium sp. UAMH 11750]|nr:hypothetical protein FS749_009263 [Ceratobasidium sp. UAMH 11750]
MPYAASSSSLLADANPGAEMFPQASQFPPYAGSDSYANTGFVSQPVPAQQHFVPNNSFGSQLGYTFQPGYSSQQGYGPRPSYNPRHGYTQQDFALQQGFNPRQSYNSQQYIHPPQPMASQYHPALQQPMAPHDLYLPEEAAAPHQPVPFQPTPAPQQFAPQVTPTAPAPVPAPATSQVLSVPRINANSKSLPASIGAVYVLEANAWCNKVCHSSGLRSLSEIKAVIMKEDPKNLEGLAAQLEARWEESLLSLGKTDFMAYYFNRRKLFKRHNKPLPPLPAWIDKLVFGDEKENQLPITARHVARVAPERSVSASGSRNKGKGKARATPYNRPNGFGGKSN